jgi:hypothetical protein
MQGIQGLIMQLQRVFGISDLVLDMLRESLRSPAQCQGVGSFGEVDQADLHARSRRCHCESDAND